jgi:hypothetical protein
MATKQAKTETVKIVNYMDMVRVLMGVKGATPATFIAVTPVKMNKTNNPYFDKVYKTQTSNVFINFDYAASVNRALVKEGKDADFVAQPRKWGEKLPGTPIVFHKNEYYLEARFLNNEPKVDYTFEGNPIDKAVFESYMPNRSSDSIKEHQGLENEVVIRDFKIRNIYQIKVNGVTYRRNDF